MADAAAQPTGPFCKIVVQQANTATLQVDPEQDRWVTVGPGLIVFVAFQKGASAELFSKIAKALLTVKLCLGDTVTGVGGDLLIVPQATLGGKLKGKQLQYHGNMDKADGQQMFLDFVAHVRAEVAAINDKRPEGRREMAVQHGTYGNVQRMRDVSNDGPFTHIFEF
eukprot:m.47366 g.47366  ORF g.47366 m.47366 type:complete len:167 (-) comp5973_c0_seq2:104-604(-)